MKLGVEALGSAAGAVHGLKATAAQGKYDCWRDDGLPDFTSKVHAVGVM